MCNNTTIKDVFLAFTVSVIIDHSQWRQIILDALDELDINMQTKFQTTKLCIGHDMADPNQLYLHLYVPSSRKYYAARYFDRFLKQYFLSANLPMIGNSRIDESLWMPYSEHTVKYGLFSISNYTEKEIVSVYSSTSRINREIIIDSSFSYDILLIRLFALIYLTASHFEKNTVFVTVNELLDLLYDEEIEPFEQFYYAEKEVFLSIVKELKQYSLCADMEWLQYWNTLLDSIVPLNKKEYNPNEAKQKFYEILSALLSTNRIPTIERISLVVAIRCSLRDLQNVPA